MLLEVKGISYASEGRQVLEGLEFELEKGKIYAVLGTNGSGKSTLLSIIAGLLEKDKGEVFFRQEKVRGPSYKLIPGHKGIALVRQDMRLTPFATVRENLSHVMRTFSTEEQEIRIRDLGLLLGFEQYLNKTLKFLSGGEQQRISIAAALAEEPLLLLMDEPFSQTDVTLKPELREYLRDINNRLGITILFVTHDPLEALSLASEILILDNGKITERGKSREIYARPATVKGAELTGICNWLDKDLAQTAKKAVKVEEKWLLRPEMITLTETPEQDAIEVYAEKTDYFGLYSLFWLKVKTSEVTLIACLPPDASFQKGQNLFACL